MSNNVIPELLPYFEAWANPENGDSNRYEKEYLLIDADCFIPTSNPEAIAQNKTLLSFLETMHTNYGFSIIVATDDTNKFKGGNSSALINPIFSHTLASEISHAGDVRHWDNLGVDYVHGVVIDKLPELKGYLLPNHGEVFMPEHISNSSINQIAQDIRQQPTLNFTRQIFETFTNREDAIDTWNTLKQSADFKNLDTRFERITNRLFERQSDIDIPEDLNKPANPNDLMMTALYQYFLAFTHKEVTNSENADIVLKACNETLSRASSFFPLDLKTPIELEIARCKLRIEGTAYDYARDLRLNPQDDQNNSPPISHLFPPDEPS